MNFFLVISLLSLKNLKLLPRFKNKLSQKDLKKIHTPSNKYQKKKTHLTKYRYVDSHTEILFTQTSIDTGTTASNMQIANLFQSGGKEIRENSVSRETYASFNYRFTNTIEREDLNKIKKERKTRGIKRKIKERKKKGRKIENSGSHERLIFEGCISSI